MNSTPFSPSNNNVAPLSPLLPCIPIPTHPQLDLRSKSMVGFASQRPGIGRFLSSVSAAAAAAAAGGKLLGVDGVSLVDRDWGSERGLWESVAAEEEEEEEGLALRLLSNICDIEVLSVSCSKHVSAEILTDFDVHLLRVSCYAFTWGTVAVLPFYTLMVLAPNAEFTKRAMESSAPYVILGVLYAYLLYLSWTPDTLRSMFASKYWLPELPSIARMFTNEMTVASAWIHLLAVDLFAARQVFHDGLKNNVETRHSVSLCLLFCPIGIATHALTKVLARGANRSH
uniref:Protein MAO HUZI 4, chloroplastic n=1 Tax=Ananas comosus var. bracteatus TaxID=296719 RepID=A0A6V7Q4P1_ANACO|nr:unnamed protein product [Ananas comosus var. bracteatus]